MSLRRLRLRKMRRIVIQILVVAQHPVSIEAAARRLREARVIHGDEGGRISVGVDYRVDPARSQRLDQPGLHPMTRCASMRD